MGLGAGVVGVVRPSQSHHVWGRVVRFVQEGDARSSATCSTRPKGFAAIGLSKGCPHACLYEGQRVLRYRVIKLEYASRFATDLKELL